MREENFGLIFPASEYQDRLHRVREAAARKRVDAVLVTAHRSTNWLVETGVDYSAAESPQWMVVPVEGDPVLVVRHLEADTVRGVRYPATIRYLDRGNSWDPMGAVITELKVRGAGSSYRIGTDLRYGELSPFDYERLRSEFAVSHFSIGAIRIQRSSRELEYFDRAALVNQHALRDVLRGLAVGMSELEIQQLFRSRHQAWLYELFGEEGDESDTAMGPTTIQVGSEHMQEMHAKRTRREMASVKFGSKNPGAWLEPGFFYHTYPGTMLRTVWLGAPPREIDRAVNLCIEALCRLEAAIAPGKRADEVDVIPRSFLRRKGYGENVFQHRAGYTSSPLWLDGGIASITPENSLILAPGMVFHSPIHVLVPGYGYIGSSWQFLVTEEGSRILGDPRVCPLKLYTV